MCLPLHNHRSTVLVSCSVVCNADSADCCCLCWMLEHFVSRMDNSGLTNELQEETDHPSDQQEKREKEKNVIKRNFCVSSGFVPSCGQVSLYIYIYRKRGEYKNTIVCEVTQINRRNTIHAGPM